MLLLLLSCMGPLLLLLLLPWIFPEKLVRLLRIHLGFSRRLQ